MVVVKCVISIILSVGMNVHGYVFDAKSLNPISDAIVVLDDGVGGKAVTTEKGEFEFTNLAEGEHKLSVSRTGYHKVVRFIKLPKDTIVKIAMDPVAYELSPITITATYGLALYAPASSNIVSKEDLKLFSPSNTDLLLNYAPGVYVKRSKGLAENMPKIYLRGFEARGIPGPGSRSAVLVDGVPLLNWNMIPTLSIEKIEVVKGPYSSLYGSNAIGGVVNYITRTKSGVDLKAEIGENGTENLDVYLGQSFDKFGIYCALSTRRTDGYVSNYVTGYTKHATEADTVYPIVTGYEITADPRGNTKYIIGDYGKNWAKSLSASVKFVFYPTDFSIVGIQFNKYDFAYGYEGGKSWLRLPDGSPAVSDTFRLNDSTKVILKDYTFLTTYGGHPVSSLGGFFKLFYGNVGISGNISRSSIYYWYASPYGYMSTKDFTVLNGDLAVSYEKSGYTFLLGLNMKDAGQDGLKQNLYDWSDTTTKADTQYIYSGKLGTYGAFLQAILNPIELVILYAGVRYDKFRTYDGKSGYYKGGNFVETEYEEKTNSCISPRIGAVVTPFRTTKLYVSYGKAFRAPTEYELYNEWYYYSTLYKGNPELKPEKGTLLELGVTHTLKDIGGLSVAFYTGNMIDMIGTKVLDSAEVAQYNAEHGTNFRKIKEKANIASVDVKGYEIGVNLEPVEWLSLSFGYNYNDMKVEENPEDTASVGKQVVGVPKTTAFAKLVFSRHGFTAALTLRNRSKVYGESDNSDTLSGVFKSHDPYTLVDLALSWKVTEHVKLNLSVTNLFDKTYYDYYRMPGRKITGGIMVELR